MSRALRAVTPHLADQLVDLYGNPDPRFYEAVCYLPQAKVLAALSLAEIERGVRINKLGRWHKHMHHDPFFRVLAMIAEQTGRSDYQAMTVAIEYLSAIQASPAVNGNKPQVMHILEFLRDMDLVFQGHETGRIHYTLRGVSKRPISGKHLEGMLAQLRGIP